MSAAPPPAPGNDPNDPFASLDSQRSFVVPRPGMRAATEPVPLATRNLAKPQPGAEVMAEIAAVDSGMNPLLALANRLLAVVPQLRATAHLADPAALKESLAQGLRDFEARARRQGISAERVMAARYVLCTVLDEAAASTPWGGSGVWGRHSLLAMFHNETWGGEKVFQLMAKLAQDPATNRDLLELIYAAVCLGFEGRWRVIEGGAAQLEAVRDRLAQIIRSERGDFAAPLAQNWRGRNLPKRPLLTWLPLWVSTAVAALLVLGLYLLMSFSLGGLSDPAYAEIHQLRLAPPSVPTPPAPPPPAAKPRLARFLDAEIRAGLVSVRDDADRSVITVRGDGLFAPGSASLAPEREALMQRIAQALAQVEGAVLVVGHTDNQPIRSVRFPSNWHLSEERAKAVSELLAAQGVAKARLRAEGRADGEPMVGNDTPAHRAINRRVEITLVAAPAASAARSGS